MHHSPILYVQHQEFAVFPHAFPMSEQKLASGTKETPMLLSMAHTARLAACGMSSEWEKTGEKSDQKMKHVGDC